MTRNARTRWAAARAAVLAAIAAPAFAQSTVVLPAGAQPVGNLGVQLPWAAMYTAGYRVQSVYDSQNLLAQGITFPLRITRLRWRGSDGNGFFVGGTLAQAEVTLATATVDYRATSTQFALNLGPDRTLCHSGPVVVAPGGSPTIGSVAPWSIDVPLAVPFDYDPGLGDLAIEVAVPGGTAWNGGSVAPIDGHGIGAESATRWISSYASSSAAQGGLYAPVVELTFEPTVPGVALWTDHGHGCRDGHSSFYEVFTPGTFDLAWTAFELVPTATGYRVRPSAATLRQPQSVQLTMAPDGISAPQNLGFTLTYPGGATSAVHIASNGFVWAQPNVDGGCCDGHPGRLLAGAARWCPLWTDLDPSNSGLVRFDVDPLAPAAYVTWTNVPEVASQRLNTFQVAFFGDGRVVFCYQQCSIGNHSTLTGWTPGGGLRDPGAADLSSALPLETGPETLPLALSAAARPLLGSSVLLQATALPQAALFGSFVAGASLAVPQPLDGYGMPGCTLYLTPIASRLFFPLQGTASLALAVPSAVGLVGAVTEWQVAAFAPGVNARDVLLSNGLELLVGGL